MKRLFILLVLLALPAYATSVKRDASVTAIPPTFAGANSEIADGIRDNNICCTNYTDVAIYLSLDSNTAANAGDDWYMGVGDGYCFDRHPMADKLFARGDGSSANTGVLVCRFWTG